MNTIELTIPYFPDPARGGPLFNANIYVGLPDLDPLIELNRKVVTVINEDGSESTVAKSGQPLSTNSGGQVEFNGKPVTIKTDGEYSLLVLDALGAQKYYIAKSSGNVGGKEWVNQANAVFVSASSIKITGDQTGTYTAGRRVKVVQTGNDLFGEISSSIYSSPDTTVTIALDTGALNSTVSSSFTSIITPKSIGVTHNSALNKSAAKAIDFIQDSTVFIHSADGGLFQVKSGSPAGTYSDDGGAFCGTIIIPTGGDGSIALVRADRHYITPTMFGCVAESSSDADSNTSLMQAYLNSTTNVIFDKIYWIGGEVTTRSDLMGMKGHNMKASGLVSTNQNEHVIRLPLNADHLNVSTFRVEHSPVSAIKDGLILDGINDTTVLSRILSIGHRAGINAKGVQFVLKLVNCRSNSCSEYGFLVNEENNSGLTSIVFDQCYTSGCKRHSKVSNSAEVLYLQPIIDITAVSAGMLEILGCSVINIINLHAEGNSGSAVGDIIKIGGSATDTVSISGLHCSVNASLSVAPWRLLHSNFAQNAVINLDGVDATTVVNFSRTRCDVSSGNETKFYFYPSNKFGSALLDESGVISGKVSYDDLAAQKGAAAHGVFNGATATKIGGFNFDGVSRAGPGRYHITFSNPLSSANYGVTLGYQSVNLGVQEVHDCYAFTATGFNIRHNSNGSAADTILTSFQVFL